MKDTQQKIEAILASEDFAIIDALASVRENYEIDAGGIIRRPGRYEGQPYWLPYFAEHPADEDIFGTHTGPTGDLVSTDVHFVTEIEKQYFHLLQDVYAIAVWYDEQGFCYCATFDTKEAYKAHKAQCERES